jgi:hypothetical protein
MGVQSFANQLALFGGRIVDHSISLQVMCKRRACTHSVFRIAGCRAVLITGIRQEKNASHCPVIDALLVLNYVALLRRVNVSFVATSII